jgi:hypothetical protein
MIKNVFLKKLLFMRKRLLFFLPVLLFLHSSFTRHPLLPDKPVPPQAKRFAPEDWLIDEATAAKMMDYYTNCRGGRCRAFKKPTLNKEVREYLEQRYTIVKAEQRMARYNDDDVERYRKARGIEAGDPKGDVSGFSTIITMYRVIPKGGSVLPQVRFMFADEYTICPPPDSPPCNP